MPGTWRVLETTCQIELNFIAGGKNERQLYAKHSESWESRNMVEMVRCAGGKREIIQGCYKVVLRPCR